MHAPTDIHLLLVKRILRYLNSTIVYGITLRKGDVECLTSYTYSDWGSCPETTRSTCGYTIFMGNSLISWSSKKHPTVSRSTTEAEYKCLSVVTPELEWLGSLFSELHITLKKPITLYCDNTKNQLAYLFTKGLCAPIFTFLLHQLLGISSSANASSVSTSSISFTVTNIEDTDESSA
ncbi:uncharacterized protein LOC113359377 [Papaver somniferum]|uniref:uncharacterized protein LOC113359377 n=1 Tax=Papaver somniferum TaxID=3469 RepID=UPI000E6FE3AB|nr:uncharacterized protein LOC113359377 [Papaver somniferum]